jgi:hypothetical protein
VHPYGLRLDINCSILFIELPRPLALPLLPPPPWPAALRSAGIDAVKSWWPSAEPEVTAV